MNYEELKPEVLPRLLDFFGIDATEKTLSTLRRRMSTDAKDRLKREAFSPDGKRKHAEASPQVKELAEHFLRAEFEALERLRASQAETAPGSREESAA